MNERSAIVVGGGIAGLLAAEAWLSAGWAVTLLEASDRLGGLVRTERVGDFVLEDGPDALLASKPAGLELVRRLGLEGELVPAAEGRASVLWRGELHPVPQGTVLGVPTDLDALRCSGLFDAADRRRIAEDLEMAPAPPGGDESIGALVRRRLGDAALERLVGPLLGGIHAGDADRLSAASTFPQLASFEREHGGLIRGARALAARAEGARPTFLGVRGGMDRLVDRLVARLVGAAVCAAEAASSVARGDDGWVVATTRGRTLHAERLVLAVGPTTAAHLIGSIAPAVAAALAGMRTASTAVVHLAYRRADVECPPDGHGFVVARGEGRTITALTNVSAKWPHRSPAGTLLLRAYAGHVDNDPGRVSGAELAGRVRAEVEELLNIHGQPTLVRVRGWPDSMPQAEVGHAARLAAARLALADHVGLDLVGGAYDGIGIPAIAAASRPLAACPTEPGS